MVQVEYCYGQIGSFLSGDSEGEKKITGDFTMILRKKYDCVIIPAPKNVKPDMTVITFMKLNFYHVEAWTGIWETRTYYRNVGIA